MAQEVIYTLIDDLDGSEAEETLAFALDGASYQIDLNGKNAAAFRKALARYVAAARRTSTSKDRGRGGVGRSRRGHVADPKVVRAWAQDNGIEISRRGRIPGGVLERYEAAEG